VAQQERAFREQAEAILELLQLQPHAHASVSSLPYGLRKVVELGRALALRPKLLLLDEPSSGLNDAETERIASWITRLRDTQGITVLMVEHDMNLVTAVSDHVLVLDAGRVIADGTAAAVQTNPAVIRAYLGD
jgi:branched-chain amino acid transport system ATP-binding protein